MPENSIPDIATIPSKKGAYALVLRCTRPCRVPIGRLGVRSFAPGYYIYSGSALGPGGLRARIGRHLRHKATRHWHIDALTTHPLFEWVAIVWHCTDVREECLGVHAALLLPGATVPVPGFGNSDRRATGCRCPAHLVWVPRLPRRLCEARGEGGGGAWARGRSRRPRSQPRPELQPRPEQQARA